MTLPAIPSLDDLNKMPLPRVLLLQHRIMHTSDMYFQYMSYKPSTIEDLRDTDTALLAYGMEDLNPAEQLELAGYMQNYESWIGGE